MSVKNAMKCFWVVLAYVIFQPQLSAAPPSADLNVLIVGNSRDSADNSTISGSSDPFDPTGVRSELESILSGAGLGSVNVELLDRSAEGHSTAVYSLAQWFHYPYPADVETTTRWPNLRGEDGTQWDYVILIGDPYTIEYMPGVYAHGVGLVGEEVAKGSAETVLLMPWPASGSASSVDHYKEVVYRAGRTGGYKVAPAGLAWQADGSQTGATHPTPRGAYISAASIYSRIWGQSASTSTYTYDDTLADLVHTTVTNNIGAVQYSGPFTFQNPYLMLGDRRRDVHFSERGSSTESRIANDCQGVLNRLRVMYNDSYRDTYTSSTPQDDGNAIWTTNPMPIGWNHGRPGWYYINPDYWQIAYGFSKQTNTHNGVADADADYAAENDTHLAEIFYPDLDFGDYLKGGDPSGRNVPFRLIWAGFQQEYPNQDRPVVDNAWHQNGYWQKSNAEFIVTLYTGRCALTPEPAPMNKTWYSQMIGYETAWRVGACSARAPGFKVMPSAASAVTVTPSTTETMTVQFIFPPRHDVTVQISSSDTSAAIVGTQTLVFTPSNYSVPQTVAIRGVEGTTASADFSINYTTSSDDPAYHELTDSWAYTTTRTPTSVTHVDNGTTSYTTPKNFPVTTNLGAPGANDANTYFAGPNHGTLSWSGSDVIYTPDTDYVGPDGFAYASINGGTVTTGYIHINVIDGYPAGSVRVETTDAEATEAGTTTGTWSIIREGSTTGDLLVYFAIGGTAVAGDYSIDSSSPITIPDGQSSVTVTLTPVDDAEREFPETVTLTITADAAYTAIANPAAITILDDDNSAPEVNAGPDQTVSLGDTSAWTPLSSTATKAWYDASDADSITANGTAVSQWNDKSGNDHHLSSSSGREPVTGRSMNSLNAIDFQGGDLLTIGNRLGFGTNPDIMALSVMQVDSTGGTKGAVFAFGNGVDKLRTGTFNGNIGWYYEGGNEHYGSATTGTHFLGCWQRPSGGNFASASYYQNGTERARAGGANDTKTIADGSSIFSLGADPDNSDFMDAAVGELIFIESNDVDLRQNVEGYLAHKWGLAGNLPDGHPHKAIAPGAASASATLDGTVTDADLDSVTTIWTLVSTSPSGLSVNIDDPAAIDTSVTFYATGTYIFRLTANDGTDVIYDECVITVGTGGGPIADVDLPAGISLYGYTGENTIGAQTAFQTLIDNSQLSLVRWVDPSTGGIKELYYTTFPSPSWINEIGDLALGQGYVVKTSAACTLSVSGNKSTASVSLDLPAGYSIIGFNKETPVDAQTAFQALIDAGKLELVRWVDPANGQIKELYYTTYPSAAWVNEIGDLAEGQGYIIKLNAAQTGFTLP